MVEGFSVDPGSFFFGMVAGALFCFAALRRQALGRDLDATPPGPIEVPADVRAQALSLHAEGRLIDAIKLVRERTGCDLKAAKAFVDSLR
jgi:hypothetical protein